MSKGAAPQTLDEENARLTKLLAEATLNNVVLKGLTSKMVTPAAEWDAVALGGQISAADEYGRSHEKIARAP